MIDIIEKPRFEGTPEEQIEQMKKFIYMLVDQLNMIHSYMEGGENDGK